MKISGHFCLTKKFSFQASHRLYIDGLSEKENFEIFDRCSNIEGHGHDYMVELRLKSEINNGEPMVVNHLDFKNNGKKIINRLDYRWIDKDIDFFKDNQSTVENLGIYLWDEFKKVYGEKVHYIKVWENKRSYFEYFEEKQR